LIGCQLFSDVKEYEVTAKELIELLVSSKHSKALEVYGFNYGIANEGRSQL
jgi:hypothetical protein